MKKFCLSNLQYLLLALVVMAMTACGANNAGKAVTAVGDANVTAKLVWGQAGAKGAAKTTASLTVPSNVATVQFTVTGTGPSGALPVVRSTVTATGGTVNGIYPGTVTVAAKAIDAQGQVVYEGFALQVAVAAGATTTIANPIVMTPPLDKAQDKPCIQCHETTLDKTGQNLVAEFKQSGHYANGSWNLFAKYSTGGVLYAGCAGCHGPAHNDADPAGHGRCFECHTSKVAGTSSPVNAHHTDIYRVVGGVAVENNCSTCHNSHNPLGPFVGGSCVACHAFPQDKTARGAYVNDNNGVRSITNEFTKWSHHVTGVTLNDAHCAACHLEAKVSNGTVVVDTTKHMVDAKIHLRNADTDADFAWDPETPNHTGMDNFCMGCHDANGAISTMSVQIQAFINSNGLAASGQSASAGNPFGDTISNRYDKMLRGRVVDVDGQFATGNFSHHAVKGKKYSGSERGNGIAARTVNSASFSVNSSATLPGVRETLKEAGVLKTFAAGEITAPVNANPANLASFNLNTMYQTLSPAAGSDATLGDDSPLHCADCHTVGQYAVKGSVAYNNAKAAYAGYTSYNRVAIGAHGSNNEYMLRNSKGTDELHVAANFNLTATVASGNFYKFNNPGAAFLVCYNCHAFQTYGSVYAVADGPGHIGEYAKGNRCNGENNTFAGYTTGTLVSFANVTNFNRSRIYDASLANGGSGNGGGNIFAIQCSNCHNAGPDNKFGGIHGSKIQTYPDANGTQQPARRFLSGLGDWKHVPMGSVNTVTNTFGVAPETGWEMEKARTGEGCYTLSSKTSLSVSVASSQNASGQTMFGTWGACADHGGTPATGTNVNTGTPNTYVTGGDAFERKVIRPVAY
jgi:hypothetical protein